MKMRIEMMPFAVTVAQSNLFCNFKVLETKIKKRMLCVFFKVDKQLKIKKKEKKDGQNLNASSTGLKVK